MRIQSKDGSSSRLIPQDLDDDALWLFIRYVFRDFTLSDLARRLIERHSVWLGAGSSPYTAIAGALREAARRGLIVVRDDPGEGASLAPTRKPRVDEKRAAAETLRGERRKI